MDNEQIQPWYHLTPTTEPTELSRDYVALECLRSMLLNPSVMSMDFDTISDFAYRQADSFVKKSKEPQI